MKIAAIPWFIVTLVGLVLTAGAGYAVVRGPFLGGATLDGTTLLVAVGAVLVGMILLALGGWKLVYVYTYY
ncbi:MAG: hypothetical protein ABEJ22_00135 [Haloferacaceae archaeon]